MVFLNSNPEILITVVWGWDMQAWVVFKSSPEHSNVLLGLRTLRFKTL